jgi:hypothetical protein
VGNPGRLHPNDDLTGAGGGDVAVTDLQSFRLDRPRQYDLDESFNVHGDLH